jgi:hypothetical protein
LLASLGGVEMRAMSLILGALLLSGCNVFLAVPQLVYETSRYQTLLAPLPTNVRILPPDPSVPQERTRETGQFVNGVLTLRRVGPPDGIGWSKNTATYQMRSEGRLEGTLQWKAGKTWQAEMTRVLE